jgi:uncharacterized protein YdhG (YjbR/CyaY superfamily)
MSAIDDYLKGVEEPTRSALQKIRMTVKQIEPTAEEAMVYGVPGFNYKGHFFIGYAAHKFKLSKGAIRFTVDNQIPESVLKKLIQTRLDDINGKL